MNRYQGGGPSQATASTVCQKCLKRGHYSYECSAARQDRPYAARPSRTQQLLNPKLAPKLNSTAETFFSADSSSTSNTAKAQHRGTSESGERGRERSRTPLMAHRRPSSARSSDSASTISTNDASPSPARAGRKRDSRYLDSDARHGRRVGGRSSSASAGRRSRTRSRSPRRNTKQQRRTLDGSRETSRSPFRNRDGQTMPTTAASNDFHERSVSPYSRRRALAKAGNGRQ